MPDSGPTTISIVMPVYNARPQLEHSLPVLLAADALEVIVVDDGSSDSSRAYCVEQGAKVIDSGGVQCGPGHARNVGVAQASGDVVLFVDADVVVANDVLQRIASAFECPSTTALYGSYDQNPPDQGFGSQYMNLRHHFGHRVPSECSSTFWSGIGAVRRQAFLDVGGFDGDAYPKPSIEDIELGMRLRLAGGRIRRVPEIQGTHLKSWSLAEVMRVDTLRRALPWSRLMPRQPWCILRAQCLRGREGQGLDCACPSDLSVPVVPVRISSLGGTCVPGDRLVCQPSDLQVVRSPEWRVVWASGLALSSGLFRQ